MHEGRNVSPLRWLHASGKRLDVVLAEGTRTFTVGCSWVRCDVPHGRHREGVDVPNLGERDQVAVRPHTWLKAVP